MQHPLNAGADRERASKERQGGLERQRCGHGKRAGSGNGRGEQVRETERDRNRECQSNKDRKQF